MPHTHERGYAKSSEVDAMSDLCIVLCIRRKQIGCSEASALARRALRQQRNQQVCIEGGSLTGLLHYNQAPEQQWYRDSGRVTSNLHSRGAGTQAESAPSVSLRSDAGRLPRSIHSIQSDLYTAV